MPETIEIPTTVFSQSRHDQAIEARFSLGERIAIRNGDYSLEIDLADVFDVRVGTPPTAAADTLTGTVLTIAFERSSGREVLFVGAEKGTLETVAGLLFRRLLNETDVAVKHPSSIGGRVTEKSFEIGNVLVTPGRVGCRGIDRPFSVDIETIVDFSRSTDTLLGERRGIIDITYVKKGVAVSLKLSLSSNRKQQLLGRFLRREYDEIRSGLRGLDVPTPARHALVTLYSRQGTAPAGALLPNSKASTAAVVRGLRKADLVELDDGEVALTSRGWIYVSEHGGSQEL